MKQPRLSPAELTTQERASTVCTCVPSIADRAASLEAKPHGRSFAANERPVNAVGSGVGDGEGEAEAEGVADGERSGSSDVPAPSVTQ